MCGGDGKSVIRHPKLFLLLLIGRVLVCQNADNGLVVDMSLRSCLESYWNPRDRVQPRSNPDPPLVRLKPAQLEIMLNGKA